MVSAISRCCNRLLPDRGGRPDRRRLSRERISTQASTLKQPR